MNKNAIIHMDMVRFAVSRIHLQLTSYFFCLYLNSSFLFAIPCNEYNILFFNSCLACKSSIFKCLQDCFFVSVIIRNHPELQGKPVAVCHSDNPRGTSEISSANYPARDHGRAHLLSL